MLRMEERNFNNSIIIFKEKKFFNHILRRKKKLKKNFFGLFIRKNLIEKFFDRIGFKLELTLSLRRVFLHIGDNTKEERNSKWT